MSREVEIRRPSLAVVKFVSDKDIEYSCVLSRKRRKSKVFDTNADTVEDEANSPVKECSQTENNRKRRTTIELRSSKLPGRHRLSVLPSIAERSPSSSFSNVKKPRGRSRKTSAVDVMPVRRQKSSIENDSVSSYNVSTPTSTPKHDRSGIVTTPSTPKSTHRFTDAQIENGTPKPKSARKLFAQIKSDREPSTPKIFRKKDLKKLREEYDEDDFEDDFDELSDQYSPSESENSAQATENESQSDDETDRLSEAVRHAKEKPIRNEFHYNVHVDEYFSSRCRASNNRISSIETPRLKEDEMEKLLMNSYCKHKHEMNVLFIQYEKQFLKWMYYLKEGFNLVMYGLGSKIDLLRCFRSKMLCNYHVLSIHGYFPGLTIKDILNSLVVDILNENKCPRDVHEALSLIEEYLKTITWPIFILVNNIDGVVLRENKYQALLSKLAAMPNIHLIASIDHINALTLWGTSKLSQFNFLWLEVTTFRPYIKEVSFEDPLRLNDSDSNFVSLSSLREIFKHLPSKTKKIFRILATEQLASKDNKQYKGISYTMWYKQAKDSFLVSGRSAFRVMLTELVDHDVIRLQNEDAIMLRLRVDDLEKFYEQNFEDEV